MDGLGLGGDMPRFTLFYNDVDKQIMSFNSHTPDGDPEGHLAQAEKDSGYTLLEITSSEILKKIQTFGRDGKLVFTDGVVTDVTASTNPEQPVPTTRTNVEDTIADLKARIEALEGA